jgi:hypothetical protein
MTKLPFALSKSKGMSEWAQGRFEKLRTGFEKALLSPSTYLFIRPGEV